MGGDRVLVTHTNVTKRTSSRIISIVSNKGGVGKSHFAINLSFAMTQTGRKVLLVDSDLGSGTTGIKFGLFPKHVLNDFFTGGKDFASLIVPTRFPSFFFIGGSAGDFDLANMNYAQKRKFIKSYLGLAREGAYSDIILDLGASIEKKVMDFALACNQVIIITTPQDIISGYGCLKGSFIRFIQLYTCSGDHRVDNNVFSPLIVVNQVREKGQGQMVFHAISNLIRESTQEILLSLDQLDGVFRVEPVYLGEIPYVRDTLIRAEMARKPVMEMFPRSRATVAYKTLAGALLRMARNKSATGSRKDCLREWIGKGKKELAGITR